MDTGDVVALIIGGGLVLAIAPRALRDASRARRDLDAHNRRMRWQRRRGREG